jgi:hypothetical protein
LTLTRYGFLGSHGGVVDKFTGDGIVCFFPEFFCGEDAGYLAISAAALSSPMEAGHRRCHVHSDRAKLDQLREASAPAGRGPSPREVDELARYVCGLTYLNEQEFDDTKPPRSEWATPGRGSAAA